MTLYEYARAVLGDIVAAYYGAALSDALLPASATDDDARAVCRAAMGRRRRATVKRLPVGWLVTAPGRRPIYVPTISAYYDALRAASTHH